MAAVEGRRAGGAARPGALRRSPRACAWSRCCCTRGCPSRPSGCSTALGRRGPLAGERAARRRRRGRHDRRAGPALPQGRGARALGRRRPAAMVDTHCHLDSCEPPDAELVERARAAGVTRIATVGMHGESIRRARGRGATSTRRSWRSWAATRTTARGSATADLEEIEGAAARPPRARDRRDGARLLPRPRPARRPAARVRGPARPGRARSGCPWSSTRAPPRRTRSRSSPSAPRDAHGDPALLLGPRRGSTRRGARLPVLVRRQRDLPEGRGPAGRCPRRCRPSCCWWRPTRPTSARSRCAASPTSPPT